jgi:hypothetical protein
MGRDQVEAGVVAVGAGSNNSSRGRWEVGGAWAGAVAGGGRLAVVVAVRQQGPVVDSGSSSSLGSNSSSSGNSRAGEVAGVAAVVVVVVGGAEGWVEGFSLRGTSIRQLAAVGALLVGWCAVVLQAQQLQALWQAVQQGLKRSRCTRAECLVLLLPSGPIRIAVLVLVRLIVLRERDLECWVSSSSKEVKCAAWYQWATAGLLHTQQQQGGGGLEPKAVVDSSSTTNSSTNSNSRTSSSSCSSSRGRVRC